MRRIHLALSLSFLATLSLTGCHQTQMQPLPGTAHPAYTITDLGVGMPLAINNQGQVVGHFPAGVFPNSKGFPYFHGCLWDKGKRIEMPTLGGWYSKADRITDSGQIIGSAAVPGHDIHSLPLNHGCLWNGVKLTDLEADVRFRGTSAVHLTKTGTVYAVSPPQGPKKQLHLWLYPSGFGPGVRRDAGVIGGDKLKPTAINDAGTVVGTWETGLLRNKMMLHHAFVWHKGDAHWIDIGTFGGSQSEPAGVNDAGQVAGTADLPDDPTGHQFQAHAFLWERGHLTDLGTLPGGSFSHPYAINNKGQVVGFSDVNGRSLEDRPVLWEHGRIEDLTKLIPSGTQWVGLDGAAGINDQGQIVGDGIVTNDEPKGTYRSHAYLLTPR
jgi:probable HAF family extracellular repeat protein